MSVIAVMKMKIEIVRMAFAVLNSNFPFFKDSASEIFKNNLLN